MNEYLLNSARANDEELSIMPVWYLLLAMLLLYEMLKTVRNEQGKIGKWTFGFKAGTLTRGLTLV